MKKYSPEVPEPDCARRGLSMKTKNLRRRAKVLVQQNTPGARNCSFSGVSVLPVNTAAGIPALGYASRDRVRSEVAVTESFRRGVFAFCNNFGISESSRMESIRNTWARLRIRLKFPGAWRIGWSWARGLVRFAFYTYSRKNFILSH